MNKGLPPLTVALISTLSEVCSYEYLYFSPHFAQVFSFQVNSLTVMLQLPAVKQATQCGEVNTFQADLALLLLSLGQAAQSMLM